LIIEGEADIILEDRRADDRRDARANDIVGEMAILGDVPRNASVRAKGPCCAAYRQDPFMRMVREFQAWRCRSCKTAQAARQ